MHPATLVLATTRLTTLITRDQITAPLRTHPRLQTHPTLQYLLQCPPCASIHAAALTLAASHIPPLRPLLRALALSQVALSLLDLADLLATQLQPQPQLDLTIDDDDDDEPAHAPF